MKESEKKKILELKASGKSIREIAALLNIPRSTVGSFIKSNEKKAACKYCGKSITLIKGHRPRVFCSDSCRYNYWKENNKDRKTKLEVECLCCHKVFYAYKSENRKFCSRECYDNFRGGHNET